jgi:hypothetical protein
VFTLSLARRPAIRRDFGFMVAAAALVVAVVVMFTMVRAFSYAIWLAIPMVAAGVVRMSARPGALAVRALIALFLAPAVTAAAAMAAVQAVTTRQVEAENSRVAAGCLLSSSYAQLASLPPGLVATDIDYGPFVLALTPHSVMSAPYHRLVARSSRRTIFSRCRRRRRGRSWRGPNPIISRCATGTRSAASARRSGMRACGDGSPPATCRPGSSRLRRPGTLPSWSIGSGFNGGRRRGAAMVSSLLVQPISSIPALRRRGRLLYDAVNPPGWRATTIEGSDQGRSEAGETAGRALLPGAAWARPIC